MIKRFSRTNLKEEPDQKRPRFSDLSEQFGPHFCKSSIDLQQPIYWSTRTERYPDALQTHRYNDQRARGHSPHISTQQRRLAVLGSGRHNSAVRARRHQRITREAWRVRATSGIGASEPGSRALCDDLVLAAAVAVVTSSYLVQTCSTTTAMPERCR